jgi:hypothetical protein
VHGRWVTGVACRAADLDDSMAADQHGRPLFTFVGWTADVADDPALPSLTDWERSYVAWASPTYRQWVGPDWHEHVAVLGGPHDATSEPVGWAATATPADVEPLVRAPGRLVLVPRADRHELWRSATVTHGPFVLAVGWPNRRILEPELLTHAAVEGVEEPTQVAVSSGGPDLGHEIEPEAPAGSPVDGAGSADEEPTDKEPAGGEPADEDTADPVDPSPDHDRSLTRGLRQFLSGSLNNRTDKLEKEVIELRAEVAALRAEVNDLRGRRADEIEAMSASPVSPGLDATHPTDDGR